MQFLKFVNFYRRFIKHFNKIIKFLIDMLQKSTKLRKHEIDKRKRDTRNKFRNRESKISNDFLSFNAYQSFKNLRNVFLKISILQHYDFFKSLRIKIDVFK